MRKPNELSLTANAAINKILAFNFQRGEAEKQRVPAQNRLYHYTTAEGLRGIVESHELWATAAYYLNDSAEVAYGCKVVSEALDGLFSTGFTAMVNCGACYTPCNRVC